MSTRDAPSPLPAVTGTPLLDASTVRWLRRLVWPLRRARALQGEVPVSGPRGGAGYRFLGHRPYVPGDDLRQVDWAAYARTDHPVVKRFAREEGQTVELLVDATASMAEGEPPKLRTAIQVAAALTVVALASGHRVRAWLLQGGEARGVGPAAGIAGEGAILAFLARCAPLGGGMRDALSQVLRRLHWPGEVVLLTDGLERCEDLLVALGARTERVTFFHFLSRTEVRPPWRGWRALVDRETGARRELWLTRAAVGRYRARLRRWLEGLAHLCHHHGFAYHRWLSDASLAAILTAWQRGRP